MILWSLLAGGEHAPSSCAGLHIFSVLNFHGQGDTICGTNSREVQLEWITSHVARSSQDESNT